MRHIRVNPLVRGDKPGTVYRTLLLRVLPDTDADTVARFEHELSSMPRYVSTIWAWQLSRVSEAVGTTAWTHVFEQEFCDVDGLMGPYLMHPIHWAVVDRWFDPETTDVIVRDRVCHSFCAITDPVLSCSVRALEVPAGRMFGLAVGGRLQRRQQLHCRPGCAPATAATTDSAG